jgi:hypothetical protein
MAIHELFAFNLLILDQSANTNIKGLYVEQIVGLTQTVRQNIEGRTVHGALYLSHKVDVAKTIKRTVAHSLSMAQGAKPRVIDRTVYQFLSIQQDVQNLTKWPLVRSQLNLTQEAEYILAKGTYSALALTHTVVVKVTRNLSVSHTLVMESAARAYLPDYYWTSFPIVVVAP